jgi:beta-phosphoglucomutase-like phosphatase (HAD superfamily)
MKPNPQPVTATVTALAVTPGACVLVGDSVSDIEAARAAGVHTIGYANKPSKHDRLAAAGADAIADGDHGMGHLARLLHTEATQQ